MAFKSFIQDVAAGLMPQRAVRKKPKTLFERRKIKEVALKSSSVKESHDGAIHVVDRYRW
jgi:hypothetical protein